MENEQPSPRTSRSRSAVMAMLGALALLATASPADAPGTGGMIALPGGTYLAGERTGPAWDTITYNTVRPFLLDATEVTVAAYGACVAAGKCTPAPATVEWEAIGRSERTAWSAYCNRDRADRADHPVNCVDWNQATAYCAWAGKRLPSEEEWEWAARNAKQGTAYPWGNDHPGDRPCWSGEGSDVGKGNRASTCAVGTHAKSDSAAGVKDLAGNVWEWTSSATVVFADSRGRGGTPVKIARGGGWSDGDPRNVSAAVRFPDLPTRRSADLGFRCARTR